jgi:hypothetical protein
MDARITICRIPASVAAVKKSSKNRVRPAKESIIGRRLSSPSSPTSSDALLGECVDADRFH